MIRRMDCKSVNKQASEDVEVNKITGMVCAVKENMPYDQTRSLGGTTAGKEYAISHRLAS